MRYRGPVLALTWVVFISCGPCWAVPTPVPAASAAPDARVQQDVDVTIRLFFVNGKPVGLFPVVRKDGHPLCPVRLGEILDFKVEYVAGSHVASLTKASGQTAVFKVGVPTAVVKGRNGQQRFLKMPLAPIILEPHRVKRLSDRMWIPLESVVDLAGGKMTQEGHKIRITR